MSIKDAVNQAADYVQATWQQVVMGAQQVPGAKPLSVNIGLRKLYSDNILTERQKVAGTSVSQRVAAVKKIAHQLEYGTGPWDMKPMLLNGPKARIGKNGRYNIIPFRHGTSDKYAPNNNFKTMPQDIYQKARELKASVKHGNGMKWGESLPAQGPPRSNPTSGYQHKNDIHEGMYRIEKKYKSATQSTYMTFRIVSEKSDPSSWIHPGYAAHHIAKSVADYCRTAVTDMIYAAAQHELKQVVASLKVD